VRLIAFLPQTTARRNRQNLINFSIVPKSGRFDGLPLTISWSLGPITLFAVHRLVFLLRFRRGKMLAHLKLNSRRHSGSWRYLWPYQRNERIFLAVGAIKGRLLMVFLFTRERPVGARARRTDECERAIEIKVNKVVPVQLKQEAQF
jgi:hypothetical protein